MSSSFNEVQDWVFSLADMPLWQPGSWQLASSFPRRQLQPASGIWAMAAAAAAAHGSSNGSSSDAAEQLLDSWLIEDEDQQVQQVADGSSSSSSFLVCVKPVSDTAVMQLRVTGGMTVLQLMRKIQSRTGGYGVCYMTWQEGFASEQFMQQFKVAACSYADGADGAAVA